MGRVRVVSCLNGPCTGSFLSQWFGCQDASSRPTYLPAMTRAPCGCRVASHTTARSVDAGHRRRSFRNPWRVSRAAWCLQCRAEHGTELHCRHQCNRYQQWVYCFFAARVAHGRLKRHTAAVTWPPRSREPCGPRFHPPRVTVCSVLLQRLYVRTGQHFTVPTRSTYRYSVSLYKVQYYVPAPAVERP